MTVHCPDLLNICFMWVCENQWNSLCNHTDYTAVVSNMRTRLPFLRTTIGQVPFWSAAWAYYLNCMRALVSRFFWFGLSTVVVSRLANPHLDDVLVPESTSTDSPTHEFVSDTFRASSSDLEEVREGMRKLGMDPAKRNGKLLVTSITVYFWPSTVKCSFNFEVSTAAEVFCSWHFTEFGATWKPVVSTLFILL